METARATCGPRATVSNTLVTAKTLHRARTTGAAGVGVVSVAHRMTSVMANA
jgi:hypothetical protein